MSWPLVRLGDLATFLNGGTPTKANPAFFEGTIPWVTGADIVSPVASTSRSQITKEAISRSATNLVPEGTVLLVTRTSVGKVAVAGMDLCFSQDITAICQDQKRLHTGFLVHFLKTKQSHFEKASRGATIKGITRDVVASLDIPLPPLDEQRRIAAILDQAEELRAKRRAAIALLDQLPQAIFLEMFGDTDASWSRGTVSDALRPEKGSIRTGPFGSQLLHSEFVDEGVAVLGIDNAVANEFRWSQRRYISPTKYAQLKRYTVRPGDVLITIMGTCGRCAIVPGDIPLAINTKHLCCITLNTEKCLPEYLHAFFLYHPDSLRYLGQTTKGAIMGGLNMEIIKSLPLTFPPLELQRQFASRVEASDKTNAAHKATLVELDALIASLQSSFFDSNMATTNRSR